MSSRRQPADIDNDDDKMTLKKPITLEEWDAVPRWPCETCGHQNHATSSHCHECCPAVKFRQKMTEAFNAAELDQWIRETHGKRVPGAPWIPMGATRRPQWYEEYYLGINSGHARGLPAGRQRRRLLVVVLRQAKRLTNHQRSLVRTLGISRRDGGPRKSGMTLMIIIGRVMDRRRRNLFQSEAAR